MSLEERFWSKVGVRGPDECWEWAAYVRPDGYGGFRFGGREVHAHRAAFFLTNGYLPESGRVVRHTCDNRQCCNPAHLLEGSHQDNMDDAVARGRMPRGEAHYSHSYPERVASGDANGSRTHPERVARGERNGQSKLSRSAVAYIRERYSAGGISQRELAREVGVDQSLISYIVRGKIWREGD